MHVRMFSLCVCLGTHLTSSPSSRTRCAAIQYGLCCVQHYRKAGRCFPTKHARQQVRVRIVGYEFVRWYEQEFVRNVYMWRTMCRHAYVRASMCACVCVCAHHLQPPPPAPVALWYLHMKVRLDGVAFSIRGRPDVVSAQSMHVSKCVCVLSVACTHVGMYKGLYVANDVYVCICACKSVCVRMWVRTSPPAPPPAPVAL